MIDIRVKKRIEYELEQKCLSEKNGKCCFELDFNNMNFTDEIDIALATVWNNGTPTDFAIAKQVFAHQTYNNGGQKELEVIAKRILHNIDSVQDDDFEEAVEYALEHMDIEYTELESIFAERIESIKDKLGIDSLSDEDLVQISNIVYWSGLNDVVVTKHIAEDTFISTDGHLISVDVNG